MLVAEDNDMLKHIAAVALVLTCWRGAPAASWADQLFQEVSKDFGPVPRGPALQHAFILKNTTSDVLRISSLRVSCGCVVATVARNIIQPGEEMAVVARLDTMRVKGMKTVTIYVHFDQPKTEEVRLWIRANGSNEVVLTPDTLAFGQVKRGVTPTVAVRVTFQADGKSRVTEVLTESNYIQATAREVSRTASETVYDVTALLRADAPVGRWFTDVWLKTDNPNMPRVRVPATVEIESVLNVSPGVVALGEVKAGAEVERRVIVRGVKPFRVVGVRGTDDVIRVRDSGDASKPVHVLTVRFKGMEPGDFARALEIQTDLDGGASIEVQATGHVTP